MKLIKNGCIYTMTDKIYEKGYVIIDGTRIKETGDMKNLATEEGFDEVYDVRGGFVMPGIVDPHCHIGMWEDSLGFEGSDGNEETDPITPQLRAIDAVNPSDRAFREALEAGVTTVVTGPGSANVFGGQFAALKTCGICVDDMIIKAPVAVKAALGENPKTVYNEKNQAPGTRMATAAIMRETLYKAAEYKRSLEQHESNPDDCDKPDFDFRMESLLPVLRGEIPLKIHAHRLDDIFTAIRIGNEFNIKITLEHATEAHLAPDKIKSFSRPVIIGPNMGDRSKPELSNLTAAAGGILEKAGLEPALMSDHPETPVKYITISAALAVREGMSRLGALKAITVNAAKYCGIEDRVGTLETGTDADIAVFDSHPLSISAKTVMVFINGVCEYDTSK